MSMVGELRRIGDKLRQQEARLDRIQGFAATHEEQRRMADLADQHRQLFQDLELSLPTPRDESFHQYRCRLLGKLKPCSREFADAPLRELIGAGFKPIADQIIKDATRLARNPRIGSIKNPGALREIKRQDQAGNTITSFHGDPKIWMDSFFSPVETCVVGFGDGHRLYDHYK